MINAGNNENFAEKSYLTPKEEQDIKNKVEFEIAKSHYNMIKIGSVANVLSGIFIIWILYTHVKTSLLGAWYSAIIITSIVDILWAKCYDAERITAEQLKSWRRGFYVILAAICLTWGSMGIMFSSTNAHYELYTITFLQVVVLGFCFTSITDFVVAAISICCLLIPTIIYRIFLGFYSIQINGDDSSLNLAFGISLFILGAFLLAACFFGARLVKKFFILSFTNVALNQKLENMNKFLEQRVKERTIELEKSLKMVTYQATHDSLTDLPNQRLLLDHLNAAIKIANKEKSFFAIAALSLNEIEKVNDGLGYQVGDLVIKNVAQRLQKKFHHAESNIRYIVTLSRKDIFVILIEPVIKVDDVEEYAKVIFSILDEPVYTENHTIKLTGSIGVCVYPRNGRDINALLMNADAAMLRAKQYGGNSINMYKEEINADISSQLAMESDLHTALRNNEFLLHYQPFIDVKTGNICGMEALVRWENPTLGLISPNNFIPLAEANGVIVPLGEWILRTACAQTKQWHDMGFTSLKVAVNLSSRQLHQKNVTGIIADILQEFDLPPESLELELTETTAFKEEVIPILQQFKAMGVNLSIDDFGTGYSGLSNLKLIAIDTLKIDKSFVQDIATNHDSRAIVANTIELAKKLGIMTLAEGVENKEQLDFLLKNGCDLIQGFYFSQPVNAEVFTQLLTSKKSFAI